MDGLSPTGVWVKEILMIKFIYLLNIIYDINKKMIS